MTGAANFKLSRRLSGAVGVVVAATALLATALALATPKESGVDRAGTVAGGRARVDCAGDTYWRTERDGDQRCPRTHGMIADLKYTRLRWSTWNRTDARGRGVGRRWNCTPRRCQWQTVPGNITIHLTRTRLCRDGRRIYTRATFSPSSGPGTQWTWSYYCTPHYTRQDPGGG